MNHIEDAEQMALIEWTELQKGKYPELLMLFHIPNGGKRNRIEAARFKKMGVKAGIPDLFLPVPRAAYHGLFVEMKSLDGKPTKDQKEWIKALSKQGYAVEVCYGFEQAQKVILDYLKKPAFAAFCAEGT